jgi:ethanolamine permease
VAGWEAIVYPTPGDLTASDSPLPLALSHIVGKDSVLYHLLITIGLFGLVASFHGILLAAGRVTYEFGRVGYFPSLLGRTQQQLKTPMWALIVNGLIGIVALFTGKTGEIITIACFGALVLYIFALITFFKLRKDEPNLVRPYRAAFYPWAQGLALVIAVVALIAMLYIYVWLAAIYLALMAAGFLFFKLTVTDEQKKNVLA